MISRHVLGIGTIILTFIKILKNELFSTRI